MSDDDERRETGRRLVHLLQEVANQEQRNATLSASDEERLFKKVTFYLENPDTSIGIFTIHKLAFAPPTIAAARLENIAGMICEKVFQPVVYTDDEILKYTEFCMCFAYLECTKIEGGVNKIVTFELILIATFLAKLAHRFTDKERLMNLAKHYEGPEKERQKWIDAKTEEQKLVDKNSVRFLGSIYKLYPEILFKVFEFVLENLESGTFPYFLMLQELNPGWTNEIGRLRTVTNVGNMISDNWSSAADRFRNRYLPKLLSFSETPRKVTKLAEEKLEDHENLRNRLSYFTIYGHQATPQDFIKLSITVQFNWHRDRSKNDFEIDDEEETEYEPVYLDNYDYSSDCVGPIHTRFHEWCGISVKAINK